MPDVIPYDYYSTEMFGFMGTMKYSTIFLLGDINTEWVQKYICLVLAIDQSNGIPPIIYPRILKTGISKWNNCTTKQYKVQRSDWPWNKIIFVLSFLFSFRVLLNVKFREPHDSEKSFTSHVRSSVILTLAVFYFS